MQFSIIVPVYNVEKYLHRCIQSLINQTYKDIEIILIDDGSTDSCPSICDFYKNKDSRIRVIHKENGGLSDARNVGLEIATGKYILFVDSDDTLILDTCQRFYDCITKNKDVDMFLGGLIDENSRRVSPTSKAIIGKKYSGEEYYINFNKDIIPCAVIPAYRREFLLNNKLLFIKGKYHEDNDFTPRAYLAATTVVNTGIFHYVRYIRDDSITQKKDKRKNLKDVLEIGYRLIDYSQKVNSPKAKKLLLDNICTSYLSMFYVTDIYQYKNENYSKYVDKRFVKMTSFSIVNRLKCVLFIVSPKAYVRCRKLLRLVKGI